MQSRPEWPRLFRPSNAPGERAVAEDRHDASVLAGLGRPGVRQAVGVAQHRRGVGVLDPVVLGLVTARIARQATGLAQVGEPLAATGQQLVHVRLMAGVPQDGVVRRVEDPVQRQRQLDDAQVRAQVSAGGVDALHDELADLGGEDLQLLGIEPLDVGGAGDRLEDHRVGAAMVRRCVGPGVAGTGRSHDTPIEPRRTMTPPVAQGDRPGGCPAGRNPPSGVLTTPRRCGDRCRRGRTPRPVRRRG